MRIAFLFAGQGAQYTGMGRELYETSEAARDVFTMADTIRGGTSNQCFSGSKEELSKTINTQPCVFTVGLAAARALMEHGIEPSAVAGFSVGELTALTFSGALRDRDGFRLVTKRAELMQAEHARTPSGMAAVLKLDPDRVESLCKEFENVYPVNYNCPGQIVVAAKKAAIDAFCARVSQQGGKAMPLPVSGGFHSPLIAGAARGLEKELASYSFNTPKYPVYANLTGLPYSQAFAPTLARQAESPVLWQKTIEKLLEGGTDTFIEVGPGKTLSGFLRKIAPEFRRVYNVQDQISLSETLAAMKVG